MNKNYMAIDQHGETYHDLGPYPRKELIKRTGRKHVAKMYIDKTSGGSEQVGYVIGSLWLRVFEVKPFKEES